MLIPHWLDTPIVHALGWTLVHTLWQAALVALIIRLLWLPVSQRQARRRYGLALGAMLLVLAGAAITFGYSYRVYQPLAIESREGAVSDIPLPPGAEMTEMEWQIDENRTTIAAAPNVPFLTTAWYTLERSLPWLVLAWLMGTIFMGMRLAGGWWQLRRLSSTGIAPLPAEWAARFAVLAARMGVRRAVELRFSRLAAEPIALRHLKPLILFPVGLINQLTVEQVEVILLHELAHIRRWDYLVNWLQSILELLFFYHPAVWWLSREVREAREHCCDDLALKRGGARPLLYAQTLTQLTALSFRQPTKLAMSAKGSNGTFTQRVKRLFGHYETAGDWRKPVLSVVVCVVILLSFGLSSQAVGDTVTEVETENLVETPTAASENLPVTGDSILPEPGRIIVSGNRIDFLKATGTFDLHTYLEGDSEQPSIVLPVSRHAIFLDKKPEILLLDGTSPPRSFSDYQELETINIDGKVVGRDTSGLKDFDPNNILSVNVMKRPQAVARYGPGAVSGVIEVITKTGAARMAGKQAAGDTSKPVWPRGLKEELFMRGIRFTNPIFVVNGENWGRDPEKIQTLRVEDIQNLDALKPEAAWNIYGEEGLQGVLIIETSGKEKTKKDIDASAKISINGSGVDPLQKTPPLYVVDGIKWVRHNQAIRDLDPADIESITVLKGEQAIEQYGEEGRHGVVLITTKTQAYAPVVPNEPLYIVNGQPIAPNRPWREVEPMDMRRLGFLPPKEAVEKHGPQARYGAILLQYTQGSGQWGGGKPYLPLEKATLHENIVAQLKAPNVEQYFIDGTPVSREVFTQFNHLHFAPKGTISFRRIGKLLGEKKQNAKVDRIRKQYEGEAFVYELGPGIVAVEFYRECENTVPIGVIYSSFGREILETETIYRNRIRAASPPSVWRIKCGEEAEAEAAPAEAIAPAPELGPEINTALHAARQIKGTFRAYPNPFQQEVKLAFELTEGIQTRISIFNAGGQLMKILVDNELLAAGRHELIWNSNRAPGGSYIVMIEAGGSRITQTIQKQ